MFDMRHAKMFIHASLDHPKEGEAIKKAHRGDYKTIFREKLRRSTAALSALKKAGLRPERRFYYTEDKRRKRTKAVAEAEAQAYAEAMSKALTDQGVSYPVWTGEGRTL